MNASLSLLLRSLFVFVPSILLAEEKEAGLESAVTFKAGQGLLIPETTAKVIGLTLLDVGESRVPDLVEVEAQVYASATPGKSSAMAIAWVTPEQAKRHEIGEPVRAGALSGRVAALHRENEHTTDLVEMVLEIEDSARTLSSGMFLKAVLEKTADAPVTAVPAGAVLTTLEGTFVYTVNGDRYVRSAVSTGAAGGGAVEITDGLYAGDRFVSSPVLVLWLAELQSLRGGKSCSHGH